MPITGSFAVPSTKGQINFPASWLLAEAHLLLCLVGWQTCCKQEFGMPCEVCLALLRLCHCPEKNVLGWLNGPEWKRDMWGRDNPADPQTHKWESCACYCMPLRPWGSLFQSILGFYSILLIKLCSFRKHLFVLPFLVPAHCLSSWFTAEVIIPQP